ncbi:MAG: CsgG/HfaB family protein [candidate division Zixibacteria bacterium]|nr:CsgG/HfaB family protein [candidate division Zixibacteria bacterium]MDD5425137.1 CsgG/HfaB family protein [candidate division Zixibacteria bacterium]
MKGKVCYLLVLGFLLIITGSVPAKDAEIGLKKKVIVGTFEDKSDHSWYYGNNPGDGMADMLITALVKSGKFKVFERAALNEILAEKNLSESDLANPSFEVARKLEIGDILVKATITEFGYKEETIGGSASKLLGKSIGGGVTTYTARVAVDLRLISIGSSEVLLAEDVAASENSRSLGVSTEDFSFEDQKSFDEHVVGKATRKVINQIVEKVAEQSRNMPWTGILIVAEDLMFIDAGTEIGITSGMQFEVKRQSKVVTHPKTGKVLKILYDDIGVVSATEVEEGITTVKTVSGSGFQNEDFVMLKK